MIAYIKGSFWTDDEIGALDPQLKLVALWVITNPAVTVLGTTTISARHFTFDTGLPVSEIDRLCTALPRAFRRVDGVVVAVNFIHHQFGRGEKLRINSMFRSVMKEFHKVQEPWLKELLVSACPEILTPLPPPSTGKEKMKENMKGKGGVGEGDLPEKNNPADPHLELIAWAKKWPGEMATGAPTMPDEWVLDFLKKMAGRVHQPGDLQRAAISAWRAEFRTWKPGMSAPKKSYYDDDKGKPPAAVVEVKAKLERL